MNTKLNLIDKAVGFVSPKRGLERAHARTAFSRFDCVRPTKKRAFHGDKDKSPKNNAEESRDKRSLRNESERELLQNAFVKYAFREFQTYLSPKKYIPQTGNTELNKKVEAMVNKWMRTADIYGRRHLLDLLSMGPGRQLIAGEHAIALIEIEDEADFKVQSIPAERIGGNGYTPESILGNQEPWQEEIKRLVKSGLYCDGREFDTNGAIVSYWIFKRSTKGDFGITSAEWEFDKKIPAESIFIWDDPLHPDEVRGVSELKQSLDELKDHAESMEAMKAKVKAMARKFITYKSELGDLPEGVNPMDMPSGKSCGCEDACDCARPQIESIPLPDGPLIDALSNDHEAKIWDNDLPNGAFSPFMECLRAQLAFSLHMPTSQLGVKGSSLQGTDVRMDNERAQAEFQRKRDIFIRSVYEPLIMAQLERWHTFKMFEGEDFIDISKGRWGFCKSPNADEGRSTNAKISKAKMGWFNNADAADEMGVSEEHMREERNAQVTTQLKDAMAISQETGAKFEVALRMIRDQSLGVVPEEDPAQPPTS